MIFTFIAWSFVVAFNEISAVPTGPSFALTFGLEPFFERVLILLFRFRGERVQMVRTRVSLSVARFMVIEEVDETANFVLVLVSIVMWPLLSGLIRATSCCCTIRRSRAPAKGGNHRHVLGCACSLPNLSIPDLK